METISLKMENKLLIDMDMILTRHRYSTRTEFIRDAIRGKLLELEKEDAIKAIALLKGSSKLKTTDEELHLARERAVAILEKKFKHNR